MKKTVYWGFVVLAAVLVILIIVASRLLKKSEGEVLVKVGDEVVTTQNFKTEWNRQFVAPVGIPPENPEEFLDDMIREKLFLGEARRQKLSREPRFRQEIENYREQLMVQMLLNKEVLSVAPPTQAEIEDYWAKNSKLFAVPDLVRVSHILIKPDQGEDQAATLKRCQEVLDKIESGADFAKLAQEYSQAPESAARGGDLGYFPKGALNPELDSTTWTLEVGKTAGPIKTELGYHIIKVTDRKPPRDKTLEEAREEVVSVIQSQKRREKFDALETRLKARIFIERNEGALNALKAELQKKP